MKEYTRTYYSLSNDGISGSYCEIYKQPRKDRVKYKAFRSFAKILDKNPLRHLIDGPVDGLLEKLHRRSCNGDCVEGFARNSDDTWRPVRTCGRLPLSAQLDLKLYDLETKNNHLIVSAHSDLTPKNNG